MFADRNKDTCPYFLVLEYQPTNGEGEGGLQPAPRNQDLSPMKMVDQHPNREFPNRVSPVFNTVKDLIHKYGRDIHNVLVFGLGYAQVTFISKASAFGLIIDTLLGPDRKPTTTRASFGTMP